MFMLIAESVCVTNEDVCIGKLNKGKSVTSILKRVEARFVSLVHLSTGETIFCPCVFVTIIRVNLE